MDRRGYRYTARDLRNTPRGSADPAPATLRPRPTGAARFPSRAPGECDAPTSRPAPATPVAVTDASSATNRVASHGRSAGCAPRSTKDDETGLKFKRLPNLTPLTVFRRHKIRWHMDQAASVDRGMLQRLGNGAEALDLEQGARARAHGDRTQATEAGGRCTRSYGVQV